MQNGKGGIVISYLMQRWGSSSTVQRRRASSGGRSRTSGGIAPSVFAKRACASLQAPLHNVRSLFNMHGHNTNTACEAVWETCTVAFRHYRNKTTPRLKFKQTVESLQTIEDYLHPGERLDDSQPFSVNTITQKVIKGFQWKSLIMLDQDRGDCILVFYILRDFDHKANFCAI